ncbi:class I SAM-dependent methyltransferase [Methanosarcina acetivorans]|nr:methyltransferase domain-containing protein [Methanosarcina acetivorans]
MTDTKICKKGCDHDTSHRENEQRCGRGSFWMHDPDLIFSELKLKAGEFFLDMGCGPGDYSIWASKIVGNSGMVYALDKWQELIDNLTEKADLEGIKNIKGMVSDIARPLPIEESCIDVYFISTVLHSLDLAKDSDVIFSEIHRVLKPDGRLAIVECKKEEMSFGPPLHMRLSPEELENLIAKYGFEKINLVDLGYNYMIQFRKSYQK